VTWRVGPWLSAAARPGRGALGHSAAAAAKLPSAAELLTGWRLVASIAGVLLLAAAASRLLGTRRSLGAIALSGIGGWVAGAALALLLARNHEHGDSGFLRNLLVFSAFFTMSATVWIEMLARPGALARAQQRLAHLPRPLRAVRRGGERVGRYAQITRIAARHGLATSISGGATSGRRGDGTGVRAPVPVRVRRALEDAGGIFVKLGQVLSTRPDLLPADLVRELTRLQDDVAPAPRAAVEASITAELGRSPAQVFAEFDWVPIAAASIGQVYKARLADGEPVIVKVQRPGVAEAVQRDLDVLGRLAAALEERSPWAAEYRVGELVAEFSERLRDELDYRIEARHACEIARNLDGVPGVRIPRVEQHLTTPRVLVMEWLDGVSVRERVRIEGSGVDTGALADALLRCFLRQMLIDGHYHADPHPGNVLVLAGGEVALVDFGAAGRLDALQQSAVRQMLLALAQRDPSLLRQGILEVAAVQRGFDDDLFERSLARFMSRHLGAGATPSAAMLNELLQLLFGFRVLLPAELSTLFRALVTLEGTLTALSPGYPVIESTQRIALEWAHERLAVSSAEQTIRGELVRLAPVLRRLPRHLDRLATQAERGDLRLKLGLFSSDEDVGHLAGMVNRVLLAFIGCGVGVMSVLLLGVNGGPAFTGRTSLYEFFGYFGLFCSAVLIMRVLVAIFRSGRS
jgi:ubiquinone biosynthesis protein